MNDMPNNSGIDQKINATASAVKINPHIHNPVITPQIVQI